MKNVKLDIRLMRKLIKESIEARMSGDPEPFEITSSKLYESADDLEPMLSTVADRWMSMYDPGDPSMAHVGERKWEQQVNLAIDELEKRLSEACDDVEEKLIAGEYHRSETMAVIRGAWDDLRSGKKPTGKRKY